MDLGYHFYYRKYPALFLINQESFILKLLIDFHSAQCGFIGFYDIPTHEEPCTLPWDICNDLEQYYLFFPEMRHITMFLDNMYSIILSKSDINGFNKPNIKEILDKVFSPLRPNGKKRSLCDKTKSLRIKSDLVIL
jgi:hypothetical protein